MQIAFLGLYGCFGHEGIGGTKSIVRRLAYAAAARGHEVSFVRTGAPRTQVAAGRHGIVTCDAASLPKALAALDGCEHVVTVYLPPRDRLAYTLFRRSHSRQKVFHTILQSWPEKGWKRALAGVDRRMYPYSGRVFCISPRLQQSAAARGEKAVLLLPPVPDEYFLEPTEKPASARLRVTYMGRLDPAKGADAALSLLKRLACHRELVEARIFGYVWSRDQASIGLHRELDTQDDIEYISTERQGYSPEVDRTSHEILKQTDVLILPYKYLSSTIDTPLVVLEGMAHLSAIVTRPLGDLPLIYGHSRLMVEDLHQLAPIERMILGLPSWLPEERQRIFRHVEKLQCRASQVAARFLDHLQA